MSEKFSFDKIPNWAIILVLIVAFVVYMFFFEKNIGYYAVRDQQLKNDTLEMQCNELRKSIETDSLIIEDLNDSASFEHYLRQKRLFVGEGETMYKVD